MKSMPAIPSLTLASERKVLRAFGEEVHLTVTGEETGRRYAQWLEITPPGGGPPPHYHTQEDEWFYVLQGTVRFLKDGEWHEAGPGSGAFMPRDSVHTFQNCGDTPLHMIVTAAPAGFETFFAKAADEFAKEGGPDMARVIGIAGEHGIHFVT